MDKNRAYLFLLIVLALSFAIRFQYLEANPPADLSWSNDSLTDTPWRVFEARNIVLFGNSAPLGESYLFFMSPVMTALFSFVFTFFGVGYFQIALVSVIFGVLSVFLLFEVSKEIASTKVALFSAFFMALSYPNIMYDRLAFLECFVVFFLLLSLLLWVKSNKSSKPIVLRTLSIFSFFVAFLFKPTSLIFAPVIFAAFLYSRKKSSTKPSLLQGIGYALIFLLAIAAIGFLDWRFFDLSGSNFDNIKLANNFFVLLRNLALLSVNRLLLQSAVLFFLSIVSILFLAKRFWQKKFESNQSVLFGAWFLFGALGLCLFPYQPPRYLIVLLPALCFLSSVLLFGKQAKVSNLFSSKVFYIWAVVFSFISSIWFNKFVLVTDFDSMPLMFSVARIVVFSLLICLLVFLIAKKNLLPSKQIVVAVLLLAFLFTNLIPFFMFVSNPSFSLKVASSEFSKDLPEGSVVLGESPEILCLESKYVCLSTHSNCGKDLFKCNPTHVLFSGDEMGLSGDNRLKLIKSYQLDSLRFDLYEVNGGE
jgi:hypothetical protein